MKKQLVLWFFLISVPAVYAQQMQDVVYLRNGSIIRGTLAEKNDTVVKIQTCCRSIFVFPVGEVVRMEQEKLKSSNGIPRQGYMNFTSVGILIGSSDDEKSAPFSLLMEHMFRFNKTIALGGFLGFEQLNENIMPVGGVMKLFQPAGRTDLYLSFSGGYAFSLEEPDEPGMEKATGGILAGTEVGAIFPVSQGSALTVGIGYRYSELNYQLNDWWRGDYTRNITYNRLVIRFGISIF